MKKSSGQRRRHRRRKRSSRHEVGNAVQRGRDEAGAAERVYYVMALRHLLPLSLGYHHLRMPDADRMGSAMRSDDLGGFECWLVQTRLNSDDDSGAGLAPSAAQRRAGPKAQSAGGIPADSRPARRRRRPYRARPLGPRPHRRQSEPHRRGHARRAHQPLHGHRGAARRLRRAPKSPPRSPRRWAASPPRSCAASPGTKAARRPAGPTSRQRSASRCSSASRARRGSDPPTSTPTRCCADGFPKAPASTSRSCALRSSRTTSTTCPADSTTGHQHTTSTLNSLATTARACRASASLRYYADITSSRR